MSSTSDRLIAVNADALARLLQTADPGGFFSNDLGVAWVDDGSGYARRLVSSIQPAAEEAGKPLTRAEASG